MEDSQMESNRINRRDFLRIAGAGAASMVIVACAPAAPAGAPAAAPAEGGAAAPAQGQVTLRVQGDPDNEAPIAGPFQEANPDIKLEFIAVTGIDHEEIASKILSMIAAGQTIDFGYSATEALQLYAGQGLATPLDEWVQRDSAELAEFFSDVHPSLIQAMMYEGSIYELPFDFNAANMYYNTQLYQENGLEHPSPDWTKDDFVTNATAITKKDDSGASTVFGYGWTNRLWGSWMPWIFVNGGNLFQQEEAPGGEWLWGTFYADDPAAQGRGGGFRWQTPTANSPEVVEALDFVVSLTNDGIAPTIALGGGETLQGFFADNKLGMTPAGGFWAGGLANAGFPKGSFDVQLFPAWKNQRHQFGTGGQWIADASEHKEEAWKYGKYRISKEGMGLWYGANGIITTPSRRSMLTAEAFAETGPEHWQVFYDTLDKHPDTAPIPAPPISNPMTTLFTNYTGRAMTGEMTPQQAMDELQKELEALVERSPDLMYPQS
jgi:ABC-type glycerol-3-phosphate transport system substrate-binding protein